MPKACRFFEQGKCTRGAACRFFHTTKQNVEGVNVNKDVKGVKGVKVNEGINVNEGVKVNEGVNDVNQENGETETLFEYYMRTNEERWGPIAESEGVNKDSVSTSSFSVSVEVFLNAGTTNAGTTNGLTNELTNPYESESEPFSDYCFRIYELQMDQIAESEKNPDIWNF